MTFLFDNVDPIASPALAPAGVGDERRRRGRLDHRKPIEIGLVNNMGDAALRATERQFAKLLRNGAGTRRVRLHCFALRSVPRSPTARHRIDSLYSDIADLGRVRLDGLIVTGAEPRTAALRDEPYWDEFRRLVDWAEANPRSTIWSCLAAHAAVLHLDGIERRRLPRKCSGVYAVEKLQQDPMLNDLPATMWVSHSRLNDLDADDLSAAGYEVLTRAAGANVDVFKRDGRSRMVFFQGHPEYDAATLQREFLRDIGRYLAGERNDCPAAPENYFCAETALRLAAFCDRARADRKPETIAELPPLTLGLGLAAALEASAAALFSNWLSLLAAEH
ncbi:homoserine O-succinyltransferase [Rhodopseudomonas palustris]|uniref:homoserine O-succinyltransferase MetA n=1 Tax=Rhodopseudomonas palustris TaxID=1076 RepID=UPI0021F3BF47|nr:homoserine O-succinyltransferase [Rhodopseudomonas palustris]UYO44201.1 homoserine O-succinyltransferase [Rhodopseudomonas palustris]